MKNIILTVLLIEVCNILNFQTAHYMKFSSSGCASSIDGTYTLNGNIILGSIMIAYIDQWLINLTYNLFRYE